MSRRHSGASAFAAFLAASCGFPASSPPSPPERLSKAAEDLASADRKRREAAEAALLSEPPREAFGAVARAAAGAHLEAAARARRILSRWGWPSPELVAETHGLPQEAAIALLVDGIARSAPVEMESLEADLLQPEKHLAIQAGVFAAIRELAALPPEPVLARLDAALSDADRPRYYLLRAVASVGEKRKGDRPAEILSDFAREESTTGWVAAPGLARLGRKEPMERLLSRTARRVERLRKDEGEAARSERAILLYNTACLLALAGREREVAAPLEASFREGRMNAAWARLDPDFDSVREAAWFREILKRYGGYGALEEPKGPEERR